tara:strand:- start:408 stop:1124 length:717 start_codon:yes stop_codon:yes gene_type:complete
MDPIIIIDFLSKEWIRNMIITVSFIALYFMMAFKTNDEKLPIILKVSSLLVLLMTLANHLILIFIDSWTVTDNLPLHLCSISAIICCFIGFIKKNQILFEFLFYAGIIGGTLSLLTPQITLYKELNFFYIMFYFKHASIITIPLFMRYNMKLNLSKNSWFKAFGLINIILFIIIPINNLLSSNYLYVSSPPQVNNPLIINNLNKIMGIPTYVFYWEIIMISLLLVLYSFFRNKKTATN